MKFVHAGTWDIYKEIILRKPELLAPAGDMACLKAAINAGADAVYLGGEEYGARAYASNFSTEELCEAVSYAHLFGVKIYLTVNTLVKEREFQHLTEFLRPIYEAGPDGVIIQDLGVLKSIKEHFPDLELHASTQMCITNTYGTKLLQEYGVSRIVPARELSLEELKDIKSQTGIEIECFVHGAMCYCYSGQCLFSSFLGGRSGNRGRCAGPCRLPYEAFGQKEKYPLSLKDLCAISMLGELIDAGIDSFKIEGRMKNPLYVAGVTSIYRKYIDRYADAQDDMQGALIEIEKEDMEILQNLYIRTELQNGYLHRHNGKEMLTMQKPGYASAPEKMFSGIKKAYLDRDRQLPVKGELTIKKGSPLHLKLWDDCGHEAAAVGKEIVVEALKRPITPEDVKKQIYKTGNTAFYFDSFSVIMDDSVFVSLKALGEIRRAALEDFRLLLLKEKNNRISQPDFYMHDITPAHNNDVTQILSGLSEKETVANENSAYRFRISCQTREHLDCVAEYLFRYEDKNITDGIAVSAFLLKKLDAGLQDTLFALKDKGIGIYLTLPPVFRKTASDWLCKYEDTVFSDLFDGYYCNGIDSFGYMKSRLCDTDKQLIADHALYICNYEAALFLREEGADGFVVPFELSHYEFLDLKKRLSGLSENPLYQEYTVYGHVPFMQTANCLKKSFDRCNHINDIITVKDRMGKDISIANHCEVCENTVYNGVPLSLYKDLSRIPADCFRICFTVETKAETADVLDLFLKDRDVPLQEFTRGHFKKGIE